MEMEGSSPDLTRHALNCTCCTHEEQRLQQLCKSRYGGTDRNGRRRRRGSRQVIDHGWRIAAPEPACNSFESKTKKNEINELLNCQHLISTKCPVLCLGHLSV